MITDDTINAAIANNHSAAHVIYKELVGRLYPICLRYASSNQEAKDYCQDAFLKLFNNLYKFHRENATFETWAHSLFRNYCIDQFRKKKVIKHDLLDYYGNLDEIPIKSEYKSIKNDFDEKEQKELEKMKTEKLIKIIQTTLNFKERTIFNMIAIDNYSYNDVVDELKIPLGTVKGVYYVARHTLKAAIKNEFKF